MVKSLVVKDMWSFGVYTLYLDPLHLKRGDDVIDLTPRQLQTLRVLVSRRGVAVSKNEFLKEVWGDDFVEEANLTQTVFLLRRCLGKLQDGGEYIETLPRVGYRIAPRAFTDSTNITVLSVPPAVVPATPLQLTGKRFAQAELRPLVATMRKRTQLFLVSASVITCSVLAWASRRAFDHPVVLRSAPITSDGIYKPAGSPLLLDGGRILFTESLGNKLFMAEVSSLGGGVARFRPPYPFSRAVAITPSQSEVVFASEEQDDPLAPILALSLSDHSIRHIGEIRGTDAAWSRDGKQIVYVTGRELRVVDAAGKDPRVLARLPDVPLSPAWSPNGDRIRFTRNEGASGQSLWEIDAAGGPARPLLKGSPQEHNACCGTWSPDGRYFIYVVAQGRRTSLWARSEFFKLALAGKSRESEFVSGPVDSWRAPLVSPDGHLYAIGEQARGETVRLIPGVQVGFAPFLEPLSADKLVYSHDAQWIAYVSYPDGSVWRCRADGSDRIRISQPGETGDSPEWSPDDRTIVYVSSLFGERAVLHEVTNDGSDVRVLMDGRFNPSDPAFSPDGRSIAFTAGGDGLGGAGTTSLRVFDFETRQSEPLPGSDGFRAPRWAWDGKWLAALTTDTHKLVLYDAQKRRWTTLSDLAVNDFLWDRSSHTIYFDIQSITDPLLYKTTIASRKIEKVADLKDLRRTGLGGIHLSLSPKGEILLLRDRGITDVYRMEVLLP